MDLYQVAHPWLARPIHLRSGLRLPRFPETYSEQPLLPLLFSRPPLWESPCPEVRSPRKLCCLATLADSERGPERESLTYLEAATWSKNCPACQATRNPAEALTTNQTLRFEMNFLSDSQEQCQTPH